MPLLTTGAGIYPAAGFVACSGTNIHVTSPNDLSNVAWTQLNFGPTFGQTDPLGGSNATKLLVNSSTIGYSTSISQPLGSLTGGVTYSFSAYIKPVAGNTWVLFGVSDAIANVFQVYFNLSGAGTVGSNNLAGTGSISCGRIAADAGGYYRISVAGAYSATNASGLITIFPVDADASGNATLNQEFYTYQVSP